MHILFSACDYPRPGAPFTAFVSEIVEEMARQGHKITVVAIEITREDNEETKAEQTTYEAAVPVQNTTPTAVNIASEKEVKKTLFELFKGKQQEKKAEELRENTLKENEYVIEVTEKKKTPGSFLRNLNTSSEEVVSSKPLAEEFDMDAVNAEFSRTLSFISSLALSASFTCVINVSDIPPFPI